MPDISISEMTVPKYFELTPIELQVIQMRSITTSDLKDAAALKTRIYEFIHLNCIEQHPARLSTLNRRFAKTAKRHGTATMDVVSELIADGLVHAFQVKTQTILATVAYLRHVKEHIPDDAERLAARERFLASAQ